MVRRVNAPSAGIEHLLLPCAGSISAGVHAGLAPEHLHEWPPLGVAFIAAAVAGSAAVAALTLYPADQRPRQAMALLFAVLIAAYLATRLVALPPLDPTREPFDLLGLATCTVEAAGLLLALRLSLPTRPFAIPQGGTR
jgi:hypothetical protein